MHKVAYFIIILISLNLSWGLEEISGYTDLAKIIMINETHVQFWTNDTLTLAIKDIQGCNDPTKYKKCVIKALCGVEFIFDTALIPLDSKSESDGIRCSLKLKAKEENFKLTCGNEPFGEHGSCYPNDAITLGTNKPHSPRTTQSMVPLAKDREYNFVDQILKYRDVAAIPVACPQCPVCPNYPECPQCHPCPVYYPCPSHDCGKLDGVSVILGIGIGVSICIICFFAYKYASKSSRGIPQNVTLQLVETQKLIKKQSVEHQQPPTIQAPNPPDRPRIETDPENKYEDTPSTPSNVNKYSFKDIKRVFKLK